jgi:hypothetical protein
LKYQRLIDPLLITSDYPTVEFLDSKEIKIYDDIIYKKKIIEYIVGSSSCDDVVSESSEIACYGNASDIVSLEGVYNLFPKVIFNGINIFRKDKDRRFYQLLISENFSSTSSHVAKDNNSFLLLAEEDVKDITSSEYINLIEDLALDDFSFEIEKEGDFKVTNVFNLPFEFSRKYIFHDNSIIKNSKDALIDQPKAFSAFIRRMKENFPEISFYADDSDRDFDKREFVKYVVSLEDAVSSIYSTRIVDHPVFGKMYDTTVAVQMEYSTYDLSLLISRRNEYKLGSWFTEIREFVVDPKVPEAQDGFTFSTLWDRNSVPENYQLRTDFDESGHHVYSITFNVSLLITIVQRREAYPSILKYALDIKVAGRERRRTFHDCPKGSIEKVGFLHYLSEADQQFILKNKKNEDIYKLRGELLSQYRDSIGYRIIVQGDLIKSDDESELDTIDVVRIHFQKYRTSSYEAHIIEREEELG